MAKSKIKKFVVEAIQFNGHNDRQCLSFCPSAHDPNDIVANLIVNTAEGDELVRVDDWIVKLPDGGFIVGRKGNYNLMAVALAFKHGLEAK